MADQWAEVEWREGVPVSARFDDPYYSLSDGLSETRHVFLDGNDLPARFRDGFHIAELGFGTGLNLLAAWAAWRQAGRAGTLRFTSFEAYPIAATDMARALDAFPSLGDLAADLIAFWRSGHRQGTLGGAVALHVVEGDARSTLPNWEGCADAWFLDGFAPPRNPDLWSEDLLAEIARHTVHGGTAATYTSAGHVRRALARHGFEVSRIPGYGRKRHMTVARKPR